MEVLLLLGLTILFSFIGGSIVSFFKFPRVTGYLLTGVILGPSVTGFLSLAFISQMHLISDFALGIIALYIGMEFEARHIRRLKNPLFYLSLGDILASGLFVFIGLIVIAPISIELSCLFGVLSIATAPVATLLVIREFDSEGPQTDHLKALVGLNNLFCIILFIILINIIYLKSGNNPISFSFLSVHMARELIVPLALGTVVALFFHYYLRRGVEENHLLLVSVAGVMLGVGLASYYSVSPLLTNLVAGSVLVNICDRAKQVSAKLSDMDYPVYVLFFALAGAGLHFQNLAEMGAVGVTYIIFRTGGKIIGPYVSGKWIKDKNIKGLYTGMGLLPQAGLAIGLATWTTRQIPDLGRPLLSTILASTVFFELIGPILDALVKSLNFQLLLQHIAVGNALKTQHMVL